MQWNYTPNVTHQADLITLTEALDKRDKTHTPTEDLGKMAGLC